VALVEALNRMAAHQVREAARLPAAMCELLWLFYPVQERHLKPAPTGARVVLFHLRFVVTHDAAPGACCGLHGAVEGSDVRSDLNVLKQGRSSAEAIACYQGSGASPRLQGSTPVVWARRAESLAFA
jgi:hypothetical protein